MRGPRSRWFRSARGGDRTAGCTPRPASAGFPRVERTRNNCVRIQFSMSFAYPPFELRAGSGEGENLGFRSSLSRPTLSLCVSPSEHFIIFRHTLKNGPFLSHPLGANIGVLATRKSTAEKKRRHIISGDIFLFESVRKGTSSGGGGRRRITGRTRDIERDRERRRDRVPRSRTTFFFQLWETNIPRRKLAAGSGEMLSAPVFTKKRVNTLSIHTYIHLHCIAHIASLPFFRCDISQNQGEGPHTKEKRN